MKWEGRRQSDNLEDRRGLSTSGKVIAGGGAIGLIFLLVQLFLGEDSSQVVQMLQDQLSQQTESQQVVELTEQEEITGQFISTVLADTEDVWHQLFRQKGMTYTEPKMVLFKDATTSACGGARESTGPFYCPGDQTVYMDMSFFNVLKERFGAKGGDFAIAYVIAHEVGHHVQHLLGVLQKSHAMQDQLGAVKGKRVSVATELQADFFAGVWAHHIKKYLDAGDAEAAISAAAAVGDDHIQKSTQGYTQPETYTHGTSEQRIYWFTRGFKSGEIGDGDTFKEVLN